jgi:hypothetical protein
VTKNKKRQKHNTNFDEVETIAKNLGDLYSDQGWFLGVAMMHDPNIGFFVQVRVLSGSNPKIPEYQNGIRIQIAERHSRAQARKE